MEVAENHRTGRRGRQLSHHLSIALLGGLVLVLVCVTSLLFWLTRKQDEIVAVSMSKMVVAGIHAVESRAKMILFDYAIWTEAYNRLREADMAWTYENAGYAVETGSFDAFAFVPFPGAEYMGWMTGDGEAPRQGVVPADTVARLAARLDAVPIDSERAVSDRAAHAGDAWLYVMTRVLPQDGFPAGVTDAELPRMILGYRLSKAADGMREAYIIGDLRVETEVSAGLDSVPLLDAEGRAVAHLAWTPPTPGRATLRALALPILTLMLGLTAVVLFVARELVQSAGHLELALQDAQAADRAKTDFLANVSHELRTPMNGVIGLAQVIQMGELDETTREMVDVLLESAHSQLDLINSLLNMARIESGSLMLDSKPFDPVEVANDVVRSRWAEANRNGIVLEAIFHLDAGLQALGDPIAFRQVLGNLVGNALKFTDAGRIDISLAEEPGCRVRVDVADTGRGIPPEQQERIFERFSQVDSAIDRAFGGAGLGLAISRSLVELMGGTISVRSVPGEGATFTVRLPLAVAATAAPPEPAPNQPLAA